MARRLRRLLTSVVALAVALVALASSEIEAVPSGCLDVNPFCWEECTCDPMACTAKCEDACPNGVEVWCFP